MCRLIKLFIFIPLTHWACCVQAQFGFEKTIKFSLDAEDPWFIFEDQQGHFIINCKNDYAFQIAFFLLLVLG